MYLRLQRNSSISHPIDNREGLVGRSVTPSTKMEPKGPFRHGLWKADGGYVLFGYIVRTGTGDEV